MKALFYLSALVASLAGVTASFGAPPAAGTVTNTPVWRREVPHSVFVIPESPKEGCRDPFFPGSERLFLSQTPKIVTPKTPDETPLILNGISGSSTHRLAIINGRTFAIGEEGEVNAPEGRVKIKCISINVNSAGAVEVTIEMGGHERVLKPREAF